MNSFSTALANLQQPTSRPEPQASISHILQRGLTKADGKMTSHELQHAQEVITQPLTPVEASSVLSWLRQLNSSKKVEQEYLTDHPDYPNGVWRHRLVYQITADQALSYRKLLVQCIRPADKRLITMMLTQLMAEKPFFDADQNQIKYRLQQLTSDLENYPYLAIWHGIDDVRTESQKRGFPETAEILNAVSDWSKTITDAFVFISTLGESQ
ncbi:hypothetical protein [Dyadobacter sp. CY323]|uniref:hypothetical protein n=1 Tax=Dyadobacter sp. CY323 TaxID=2907302 RepID=UPI001F37D63B|nr:hypothetical protein [Dyadobacter sp. CY323]MCE6993075.1 hypothetical protein [Dyadobacter sp. CY323]